MSMGVLDPSSIGQWLSLPVVSQILIAPLSDQPEPGATLGQERFYIDRAELVRQIVDRALRAPSVQPSALARLVNWLANLPASLPNPFIAIGDDGSVSSEWDISDRSLHVTFFDDGDEVYFSNPDGDEWEATTDAVDKVSAAIRTIAVLAQG